MENIGFQEAPWWRAPGSLRRFIVDLIDAELCRLRHVAVLPPMPAAADQLDLVADLGADSLELTALSAALAEALQLPQAQTLDALLADTALASWVHRIAAALEQAGAGVDGGDVAAPLPAVARLVFRTSGSAGVPKPCVHGLDLLWQETAALAALLDGRRRIVSVVPAHHIYGFLFSVLLPQALGLEVVAMRQQHPASAWRALRAGDLVIGHPAFWQAALGAAANRCAGDPADADAGQAGDVPLAADVVGVSSTAPLADSLAAQLAAAGLARLLQVYGSSETAGVGWRDSAGSPYRCLSYWQPEEGDDSRLRRRLPDGGSRVYPLPDRLAWQDSQHFLPCGRRDDAVQVSGINVFPQRVAALLRQHPAVADAAVRLMRADEGVRLKAFIALADAAGTPVQGDAGLAERQLAQQLDAWLRTRTAAVERPASYSFGAALPRQRNGKLADWVIDAG